MKIPVVSDIAKYTRLAFDLRDFLKEKITLEQSKQVLSARLRNRARAITESSSKFARKIFDTLEGNVIHREANTTFMS